LVLASYLETKHKEGTFGRGTRAIEFGSGCGVVGIAAAALGATVTVTDCEWVVPLTLINIEKNKEAIAAAEGSIACRELFWFVAQRLMITVCACVCVCVTLI
jgi:predicted nicotinamide N-methyase